MHWILIYSFVNGHMDLFSSLSTDDLSGQHYLSIIQTQSPYLMRHLIASLLLEGRIYELNEIANSVYWEDFTFDDSSTRFLKALFLDFDYEAAAKEALQMKSDGEGDILLGKYA